jgi:hypothetical protein
MLDNLFLGLATLLATHWLASSVPHGQQAVYRLVALAVAMPFGFRYEVHARAGASTQVAAAVVFGLLGEFLILALDAAISGEGTARLASIHSPAVVEEIVTISLSHLTGSWIARWARRGEIRKSEAAAAREAHRRSMLSAGLAIALRAEPEKIRTQLDAIKGILEAGAPVAAAAATAWSAFGHLLF